MRLEDLFESYTGNLADRFSGVDILNEREVKNGDTETAQVVFFFDKLGKTDASIVLDVNLSINTDNEDDAGVSFNNYAFSSENWMEDGYYLKEFLKLARIPARRAKDTDLILKSLIKAFGGLVKFERYLEDILKDKLEKDLLRSHIEQQSEY